MGIIVFGKNGNISSSLGIELRRAGLAFGQLGQDQVDFLDGGDMAIKALDYHCPTMVINAAAFTQVDLAEKKVDDAFLINTVVPGRIAKWCAERDIPMIHYSTDYVFDGQAKKSEAWSEDDPASPINVYGRSKLDGENAILEAGVRALILRTSWLFCSRGSNFYITMHRLGQERELLRVVSDQIGSPTYTHDIAIATIKLMRQIEMNTAEFGVFNICNSGYVSWNDFARKIFEIERSFGLPVKVREVLPVKTDEYGALARRPLNSRMDTSKIKKVYGIELRNWQLSLRECIFESLAHRGLI